MSIVLVGVNHRTAPVELREKLSFITSSRDHSLNEAMGPDRASEMAVICTCNRFELYFVPAAPLTLFEEELLAWVSDRSGLSLAELHPLVYRKKDRQAVQHLLRVACGLDSQILGETQILGQISESFVSARTEGTIGPLLTLLLARALHAGKRARTETRIAQGGTSISHAAASLIEAKLGGLLGKRVIVIGAGETAGLAVQAIRKHGNPQVACVSRSTLEHRSSRAVLGCEAVPWSALSEALSSADAVISATSAPHPILYPEDLTPVLEKRCGRPLVLVDIAVPRDIDSRVRELPSVVLFDIDELETTLDENRVSREAAVPRVEEIVSQETEAIMEWLQGRRVAPLIHQLRTQAGSVADEEARRAIRKLDGLSEREQEVVVRMARRIANKILHQPTVRLKAQARQGDGEAYVAALAELFGLEGNNCDTSDDAGNTGQSGAT